MRTRTIVVMLLIIGFELGALALFAGPTIKVISTIVHFVETVESIKAFWKERIHEEGEGDELPREGARGWQLLSDLTNEANRKR